MTRVRSLPTSCPRITFTSWALVLVLATCATLAAPLARAQTAQATQTASETVSLPSLLPADVVAAVGWRATAHATDRLATFVDEARRLDLAPLLASAIGGATGTALEDDGLRESTSLLPWEQLLNDEAWIVVTASRFDPLPAITALARIPPDAVSDVGAAVEAWGSANGVERREEMGRTLYLTAPPNGTEGVASVPLAFAAFGDVLTVSTDPEVVRFVARALSGVSEPSFAASAAFATFDRLPPGNGHAFLDLPTWIPRLRSLANSVGVGDLIPRTSLAASTAGPLAAVWSTTDEGLVTTTVRLPDRSAGDDSLAALLVSGRADPEGVARFAPPSALTVSSSNVDVAAWWEWLDDLSRIGAPFGVPSLTELAALFGVDVDRTVFAWIAPGLGTITLPAPVDDLAGPSPDVPLLGATAWIVPIVDASAARRGTDELLATLGVSLGAFLSPLGDGQVAPVTTTVAGVPIRRLSPAPNLVFDVAVLDDVALISTAPDVTVAVLEAYAANAVPAWVADAMLHADDALAWSVTNAASGDDLAIASTLAQLQSLAGLAGGAAIDFAAVDAAGEALARWTTFLADRTGVTVDVVRLDGEAIVRTSRTSIRW